MQVRGHNELKAHEIHSPIWYCWTPPLFGSYRSTPIMCGDVAVYVQLHNAVLELSTPHQAVSPASGILQWPPATCRRKEGVPGPPTVRPLAAHREVVVISLRDQKCCHLRRKCGIICTKPVNDLGHVPLFQKERRAQIACRIPGFKIPQNVFNVIEALNCTQMGTAKGRGKPSESPSWQKIHKGYRN